MKPHAAASCADAPSHTPRRRVPTHDAARSALGRASAWGGGGRRTVPDSRPPPPPYCCPYPYPYCTLPLLDGLGGAPCPTRAPRATSPRSTPRTRRGPPPVRARGGGRRLKGLRASPQGCARKSTTCQMSNVEWMVSHSDTAESARSRNAKALWLRGSQWSGRGARRDATCPVSTGGGTRRVQSVWEGGREGGGRGAAWRLPLEKPSKGIEDTAGLSSMNHPASFASCPRRVRLVRGEGRDVSD